MFGITIIRTADLPFHREVDRLIKANPDYLEGIRLGMVHLKYRPGMAPKRLMVVASDEYQAELPQVAVSGVDE